MRTLELERSDKRERYQLVAMDGQMLLERSSVAEDLPTGLKMASEGPLLVLVLLVLRFLNPAESVDTVWSSKGVSTATRSGA